MKSIKVWLRPVGHTCKTKVEGGENADWLRNRLSQEGLQCTSPQNVSGTACYIFHASEGEHMHPSRLEALLSGMPEVELQLDPS